MFNSLLKYSQENLNIIYKNSLLLQNIDKLIFVSVLALLLLSTVMSSDILGFIALITLFLTVLKVVFKQGEKFEPNTFELWLLAYFMLVIVSLAGSSLFLLSLKGFVKTLTYLGFYVSLVHFLKDNRDKIPYIIATIAVCVCCETVVAVMQNFAHVEEISTWQDVSKLNPEQIMTRVYGTLKPLNPNLLGGYFVAGIPSLFGLGAMLSNLKNYKAAFVSVGFGILSIIALFLTGCRGAYIGCMVIVVGLFAVSARFLWNKYKKIFVSTALSCITLFVSAVLFISSLRARLFSIFAMRQDSSNSFRFNVYQSSWNMFQDNWLLGIGVGNKNFREIYGLYMRTGFDALSAYNIYLETAVESGIFALIAFIGFIVLVIKRAVGTILNSEDAQSVIFVATALISVCAMLVHGFVDTVFFRPQIQFVFWTMVAVISTLSYKDTSIFNELD